jgi:dihydrodipicolinate synthase/N-acetylneuraminate lyase
MSEKPKSSTGPFRGVYPILVTPFDEQDRVDVDSLQSLVAFLLEAGVHGVGVALGSEVLRLTEPERVLVTRTVVDAVAGRVPVVINTSGMGTAQALHYSRMAHEDGADALMLTGPSFLPSGDAGTRSYFKAVSDAEGLPIFIQDISNQHISADLALQIADESEWVRYIKVESAPTTLMVGETARKAGDRLIIFGGAGGDYFIEELRRGSQGTMPGCSTPEGFVEVWDRFWAGDEAGALNAFYTRILPVNRLCAQGWGAFFHVHKQILKARGVIRTARLREPAVPLDDMTQRDLQTVIEAVFG